MDLIVELICHVKVIWISWNWKVSTFLYQSALKVCRTLTPSPDLPLESLGPPCHPRVLRCAMWAWILAFCVAQCVATSVSCESGCNQDVFLLIFSFISFIHHLFASSHHSAFNWYHFQYLGSLSSYQGWDDWRQSFKGLQIFHPNFCKVSGLWPDCLRHRSARCNWPNSCHCLSRFSFGQHFGVGSFHVKTRRETNETGNLRQHWDDFWKMTHDWQDWLQVVPRQASAMDQEAIRCCAEPLNVSGTSPFSLTESLSLRQIKRMMGGQDWDS